MKKEYYLEHREDIIKKTLVRQISYRNTPMGRAVRLANNYINADKIANRGKGDLTAKWIVENIFTQPCTHCGKTGWNVIGCNRIDNSKPHTMDNVEPCCKECNRKEYYNEHKVKVGMFDLNDNLIKEFNSIKDCVEETNIGRTTVTDCCNNKYLREGNNIYKQYKFKKLVC